MTISTPPVIPAQGPVAQRQRDPFRQQGYHAPRFAGSVLRALALLFACLGSTACVGGALLLAKAASAGTPSGEAEPEAAVKSGLDLLAGTIGGMSFLVAGTLCLAVALACWLGSVRYRWMSAVYTRLS